MTPYNVFLVLCILLTTNMYVCLSFVKRNHKLIDRAVQDLADARNIAATDAQKEFVSKLRTNNFFMDFIWLLGGIVIGKMI